MRRCGALVVLSLLLAAPAGHAADALDPKLMDEVAAQMAAGDSAAALAALQARQGDYPDNAQFDYLLGLAALDSGHADLAVAALERVVRRQPDFAGAPLELARAYLATGQEDKAQELLDRLLASNPSPGSRATIERYLSGIERRAPLDLSQQSLSWFIDLGGGYDTNANGSTSDTEFLGFTLNPRYVERESSFAELGTGLAWQRGFDRDRMLTVQARATHRAHVDAPQADQTAAYASAALHFKVGKARAMLGINAYNGWLDGRPYETASHIDASISRVMGGKVEVAALARVGRLTADPVDLRILDVDRTLGGVSVTRHGLRSGTARIGAAMLGGRDEVRRAGSPFANDKFGARVFGSVALRPARVLFGELLYLDTRFDGRRFFGSRRKDRQLMGFLGMELADWPARKWTLSPQLRWTDNRSNVALFRYDRLEAMLYVRRSFN